MSGLTLLDCSKESGLESMLEQMRVKNALIQQRHEEVQRDRREAEKNCAAVTNKDYNKHNRQQRGRMGGSFEGRLQSDKRSVMQRLGKIDNQSMSSSTTTSTLGARGATRGSARDSARGAPPTSRGSFSARPSARGRPSTTMQGRMPRPQPPRNEPEQEAQVGFQDFVPVSDQSEQIEANGSKERTKESAAPSHLDPSHPTYEWDAALYFDGNGSQPASFDDFKLNWTEEVELEEFLKQQRAEAEQEANSPSSQWQKVGNGDINLWNSDEVVTKTNQAADEINSDKQDSQWQSLRTEPTIDVWSPEPKNSVTNLSTTSNAADVSPVTTRTFTTTSTAFRESKTAISSVSSNSRNAYSTAWNYNPRQTLTPSSSSSGLLSRFLKQRPTESNRAQLKSPLLAEPLPRANSSERPSSLDRCTIFGPKFLLEALKSNHIELQKALKVSNLNCIEVNDLFELRSRIGQVDPEQDASVLVHVMDEDALTVALSEKKDVDKALDCDHYADTLYDTIEDLHERIPYLRIFISSLWPRFDLASRTGLQSPNNVRKVMNVQLRLRCKSNENVEFINDDDALDFGTDVDKGLQYFCNDGKGLREEAVKNVVNNWMQCLKEEED